MMIKKRILFSLSLLFILSGAWAQTQLPNLGFENWQSQSYGELSFDAPAGWSVGEICAEINNGATACSYGALKSADAYEGASAVQITSDGMMGLNIMDIPVSERPDAIALYFNMENFDPSVSTIVLGGLLHKNSFWVNETVYVQEAMVQYTSKEFASGYHKVVIPFVDVDADAEDSDPTAEVDYLTVLFYIENLTGGEITSSALVDNIMLVYDGVSEISEVETSGEDDPTTGEPSDGTIRLLSTELYLNEDGDGYYPEDRYTFSYNEKGQMVSAMYEYPQYFNVWEEEYTQELVYNSGGVLASTAIESENDLNADGTAADPDNFERSFLNRFQYNADGKLSSVLNVVEAADYDDGTITKDSSRYSFGYTYDLNGNLTEYTQEGPWGTYSEVNTYNSDGLRTSCQITNSYGESFKYDFTYNENNQMETWVSCKLKDGSCGSPLTDTYTYDENGNLIEILELDDNDVDIKTVFEYNLDQANAIPAYDRELLYDYIDIDFMPDTTVEFTNLITKLDYYERWDDSEEWERTAYLMFNYSGIDNNAGGGSENPQTGNENENGQNGGNVASKAEPMPANLTVQYRKGALVATDLQSAVQYQLYTAAGQPVSAGTFEGSLDVSDLNAGTYIAKVKTGQGQGIVRFIAQ